MKTHNFDTNDDGYQSEIQSLVSSIKDIGKL